MCRENPSHRVGASAFGGQPTREKMEVMKTQGRPAGSPLPMITETRQRKPCSI